MLIDFWKRKNTFLFLAHDLLHSAHSRPSSQTPKHSCLSGPPSLTRTGPAQQPGEPAQRPDDTLLPLFFFTTESRVATVGTGGFRRRTRLRWPRRDSTPIQKPVRSHGAVQRGPRLAETVWPRKPETVAGIALVAVRGLQRRLSGGGRKERFWIAELVAAWLGVSFRRAERAGGGSGSASAAMADGRGGNGGRERFRLARRAIHGGAQGADEAMHASYWALLLWWWQIWWAREARRRRAEKGKKRRWPAGLRYNGEVAASSHASSYSNSPRGQLRVTARAGSDRGRRPPVKQTHCLLPVSPL
jgi:hypothetical protein